MKSVAKCLLVLFSVVDVKNKVVSQTFIGQIYSRSLQG
jgi:hypothetical protein